MPIKKGGQWRPEYNQVIAGMLGIQNRVREPMQIMQEQSQRPPEEGEGRK